MEIKLNFPAESDQLEVIAYAEDNHRIVNDIITGEISTKLNISIHSPQDADMLHRVLSELKRIAVETRMPLKKELK
jgi:hypothetical protein